EEEEAVRKDRVGVDAARTDLEHQVHAHGVAAEREERAVAEREDAAIAPDQVDRKRQQGVAYVLAEQRYEICRHVKGRRRRQQQVERRHQDGERREHDEERDRAAIERARDESRDHASTARPLRAKRPRGRFWMNRMISTRMAILPSTAPANGSRNLLAMPSESAPTSVPHRFPTPPNTTTMKLSMM